MELSREERWQRIVTFYKEKFNIDLNNYSPQQAKLIINEINHKLNHELELEMKKNAELELDIYKAQKKIIELAQQINDKS